MEEIAPQQSSKKAATWKCENAYKIFLFTTQWLVYTPPAVWFFVFSPLQET